MLVLSVMLSGYSFIVKTNLTAQLQSQQQAFVSERIVNLQVTNQRIVNERIENQRVAEQQERRRLNAEREQLAKEQQSKANAEWFANQNNIQQNNDYRSIAVMQIKREYLQRELQAQQRPVQQNRRLPMTDDGVDATKGGALSLAQSKLPAGATITNIKYYPPGRYCRYWTCRIDYLY